jgi:hypothetical protein
MHTLARGGFWLKWRGAVMGVTSRTTFCDLDHSWLCRNS